MPTAKRQYQELVDRLVAANRPDVKVSRMYGIPVLTVRGRAFAGLHGENLVVRLDGAALAKARHINGAQAFEPAGGRDMPDWLEVPVVHVSHWRGLMQDALYYITQA